MIYTLGMYLFGFVVNLVSKYTREAGVRSLERQVGALCRAFVVKVLLIVNGVRGC